MHKALLIAVSFLWVAPCLGSSTHAICQPTDIDCWDKTAVASGREQLVSIKVLKDFHPESTWTVNVDSGFCVVYYSPNLTTGMDTSAWRYDTGNEEFDPPTGEGARGGWGSYITVTVSNREQFQIVCGNYVHPVQPEQFQDAFAGILQLKFDQANLD